MKRDLRFHTAHWPLARVFTLSRGSKTGADVVVVEVEEAGRIGRGECVPYPRYGETVDSVLEQIRSVRDDILDGSGRAALSTLLPAGAARNAIDCALWDLEAKCTGQRVWTLAGLVPPTPSVTAYTLSLDDPEAMGEAAARNAGRPLLKLKLDRSDPVARVRAVRAAAPRARLIVDVNEGWSLDELVLWQEPLAELGVAMIEQPLPASHDQALQGMSLSIPLGADESCHVSADLDVIAARYQVVNIKLDKTGGLSEALRLRDAAREAGLGVMIGCMVGTSLSMAPATLLTPGAAFVDLDGPLLLARDRSPGLQYTPSHVYPPEPDLWG